MAQTLVPVLSNWMMKDHNKKQSTKGNGSLDAKYTDNEYLLSQAFLLNQKKIRGNSMRTFITQKSIQKKKPGLKSSGQGLYGSAKD
jgi:hypothetical protein